MQSWREFGKKVLPSRFIDSYRRRRALRTFMSELSYELYDRQIKLLVEDIEGSVLARRPAITDRLSKDLLTRTDLLLQELDRRIEGVRARQGEELRSLRNELAAVRDEMASLGEETAALRSILDGLRTEPPSPTRASLE